MASEFSIPVHLTHSNRPIPSLEETPVSRFIKYSQWYHAHVTHLEDVNSEIAQYEASELPAIKRLETIKKVIYVASLLIPILITLGILYMPAWLPFGVLLPTAFIVSGFVSEVEKKIDLKKRAYETLINLREMNKDPTINAIRPIGMDVESDPRLRSDLKMKISLDQGKVQGRAEAKHIERLVMSLDFEINPSIKLMISSSLAGIPDHLDEWRTIQMLILDANQSLREGNTIEFQEKMALIAQRAKTIGGLMPELGILPSLSARDQILALLNIYRSFSRQYQKLYDLHEEQIALFGSGESEKWDAYLALAREVKAQIETKILPLFDSTRQVSIEEWLLEARWVQESQLMDKLRILIENTKLLCIDHRMKNATHPLKQLEAYRSHLVMLDEAILSSAALDDLKTWMDENPDLAKNPVKDVVDQIPYSQEISNWLEMKGHEEQNVDPVKEIYNRNHLMRLKFDQAMEQGRTMFPLHFDRISLKEIQKKERNGEETAHLRAQFSEAVRYAPLEEDVSTYNRLIIEPLRDLLAHSGQTSFFGILWRAVVRKTKSAAQPFLPPSAILDRTPLERGRKIEELTVNAILKDVDKKIIHWNWFQRFGLEGGVLIVALVVDIVFFSNPWVIWGTLSVDLIVMGASFAVKKHLEKETLRKQSLKQHMILRDHPNISRGPGIHPGIKEIESIQKKYDLDGVIPTCARILEEGEEVVFSSPYREAIRQKGIEQAEAYLHRRLVILRSLYDERSIENPEENLEERRQLWLLIEDIRNALYPPLSDDPRPPTFFEILVKKHDETVLTCAKIEKELDQIVQEKILLEQKRTRLAKAKELEQHLLQIFSHFDMDEIETQIKITSDLKSQLEAALESAQLRNNRDDIQMHLEKTLRLLSNIHRNSSSDQLQQELEDAFEHLKGYHPECLQKELDSIQLKLIQLENDCQNYIRIFNCKESIKQQYREMAFHSQNHELETGLHWESDYMKIVSDSFDRELESLTRFASDCQARLNTMKIREKNQFIRIALERQINRLDPNYEKTKKEFIDKIRLNVSEARQRAYKEDLDAINQQIMNSKQDLDKATNNLSTALASLWFDENREQIGQEVIDEALGTYERKLREIRRTFSRFVALKANDPNLYEPLCQKLDKIKSLINSQKNGISVFRSEERRTAEIDQYIHEVLGIPAQREQSLLELIASLSDQPFTEDHLEMIRACYGYLNSYEKGRAWWLLPQVLRDEITVLKAESRRIKGQLETELSSSDPSLQTIRDLYHQLIEEDQEAIYSDLPQDLCEEIAE